MNNLNGILKIEVKDEIDCKFLKIKDFEIHCLLPVYEEKIIKAFSESYDENYIYFLLGGIKIEVGTKRNLL